MHIVKNYGTNTYSSAHHWTDDVTKLDKDTHNLKNRTCKEAISLVFLLAEQRPIFLIHPKSEKMGQPRLPIAMYWDGTNSLYSLSCFADITLKWKVGKIKLVHQRPKLVCHIHPAPMVGEDQGSGGRCQMVPNCTMEILRSSSNP